MQIRQTIRFISIIIPLIVAVTGCSTGRNTTGSRAYHQFNSRYNSYHNARKTYNETLERHLSEFSENWYELLPFYPTSFNPEKTQPGGPYDIVIDKLTKNIQDHSITAKPSRDPSKAQSTEYRQWLRQNEFNPFMKDVWLLLGKAHLQNGDYEIALSVFSEISHIFPENINLISESQIWIMRAYTELNRFYDADNMAYILQSRRLPEDLKNQFTEGYAHLQLKKKRYAEAIPFLKEAIDNESNLIKKKRMQFILGQTYRLIGENKLADITFRNIKGLRTPPTLSMYASVYLDSAFVVAEQQDIVYDIARVGGNITETKRKPLLSELNFPLFPENKQSHNQVDGTNTQLFTFNEAADHHVLLLPQSDSNKINELLFYTANFNFSNFNLRTFKLSTLYLSKRQLLNISSFYSYNDAVRYVEQLETDYHFKTSISSDVSAIIISEYNLSYIHSFKNLEEYSEYYTELIGKQNVLESYYSAETVAEVDESVSDANEPDSDAGVSEPVYDVYEPVEDVGEPINVINPEPKTEDSRITPSELKRSLEQKEKEALMRAEKTSTDKTKSREQLLKEREREREERIRRREQELKERQRKREAEIRQRELNRRQR